MTTAPPATSRQLRSLVKKSGEFELSLVTIAVPNPRPHQVVVRVEASPINPSDIGLLLGPVDFASLKASGSPTDPIVTGRIPDQALAALTRRFDQSMPVGNEGAGVVVSSGSSPEAQALLGRTVTVIGGAMYTQYRCVNVDQCMLLPQGTQASAGASLFVNPLTALGMIETMRHEGHTALIHTAAASTLGVMLNRICLKDKIGLVNIVRKPAQAEMLTALGATHVCNSEAPDFSAQLTRALVDTGATLAFDAIGGGLLAEQILSSMEAAITVKDTDYARYGSATHKQVYVYGGLSRAPTTLSRGYGMAWGIGGWLVFPALAKFGVETTRQLKARVVAEMSTTFAISYGKEISLADALRLDSIAEYAHATTGKKYLINPNQA